ncbi:helix-turn-helix domain-containing protein [Streptomyces tunisiensis]|uniref:helix-turn-helix domain-containing protein n=1 Tax=Streptomyces tunisiensis TaxID=948699 RepID=UPI00403DED0B
MRVARNRGPGVTVEQVATDFGVHPMTLWKWMRRADIGLSSLRVCPVPAGVGRRSAGRC